MAYTLTKLTTGNDTSGATSSTTASITIPANTPTTIAVDQRTGITADPNQPTVSGTGLTWVLIGSIVFDTTTSSRRRINLYRTMTASGFTGTLTIDYGGQAQTDVLWEVNAHAGLDTSGSNGSGAFGTGVTLVDETGSGTNKVITLAAFASSSNLPYGIWGTTGTGTPSAGSGFIAQAVLSSIGGLTLMTEVGAANDNTVDANFSAADQIGGVAVELKLAAASGAYTKGNFFALMG